MDNIQKIQVKSMPENTFYMAKVVGLSHSSEVGAYRYCIAVPNLQGNDATNFHIHKMFLIPEIKLCSETHRHDKGGDPEINLILMESVNILMLLCSLVCKKLTKKMILVGQNTIIVVPVNNKY